MFQNQARNSILFWEVVLKFGFFRRVQLNDYHWAALCCEKIQLQKHNMPQPPQYSGERTIYVLKDKAGDPGRQIRRKGH
jgi:hypothetical protein